MRPNSSPKGIIFDLGDVLFTWSPNTSTIIPARMLKSILSSSIWRQYECGFLNQNTCYHHIAQHFTISASEIAEAFSQARDSLQPNPTLVSFIRDLKEQSQGTIKTFAMSNVSREDYAILSTKMTDWSIFDQVFTSGHVGKRKPDLEFYRHVLQKINMAPEETLFLDDKVENVLAARSLGITGIVFDQNDTAVHALTTALRDPVGRAFQYLRRHAQRFDSITDTDIDVPDNSAQLLILDAMQDQYVM